MEEKNMYPFKEIPTSSTLDLMKYKSVVSEMPEIFCPSWDRFKEIAGSIEQKCENYLDASNMTRHKPESCGIDLREYIAMINDKDHEYMLCLFVDTKEKRWFYCHFGR